MLKQKAYNQQFSHVYVNRLLQLRAAVAQRVGVGARVLPKIIDLSDGDECVIIGTALKVLHAKPNLFDALLSEDGVTPIEQLGRSLASDDDQLILEDESGRVELVGDVDVGRLVTGVVLGVRGVMNAGENAFSVSQIYWPAFPPQPPLPARAESEFVALVSGLSLGRNSDASPLRTHVLLDYLAGRIGDDDEKQFVSRIVRTIVVGNSVHSTMSSMHADPSSASQKKKSVEELSLEADPMKNVDELLSSLACAMCVDVMPGPSDPSNYTLPQQSFHPCLFPRSTRFASFRAVTNPYEAEIGGVTFFGHAGQPLDSMLQCTMPKSSDSSMETDPDDDALDCLENCLQWRHAAPTAPDLVACFPMANDDPFILETCPHVFFAGNQKRFSTRLATGARFTLSGVLHVSPQDSLVVSCCHTLRASRCQERASARDQRPVVRGDLDDRARGPEGPLVLPDLDLIMSSASSSRLGEEVEDVVGMLGISRSRLQRNTSSAVDCSSPTLNSAYTCDQCRKQDVRWSTPQEGEVSATAAQTSEALKIDKEEDTANIECISSETAHATCRTSSLLLGLVEGVERTYPPHTRVSLVDETHQN